MIFDCGLKKPQYLKSAMDSHCMKVPTSFFAVPPTVRRSILMVGIPTSTGTALPYLEQVARHSWSFRALATMEKRVSTSGSLPIIVADLVGDLICPVTNGYA